MAKLTRVEHKIFASEAPANEIGQFGSAKATTKVNTSDVSTIQALDAYKKGWGSAVTGSKNYPALEEMNGAMKVQSYHTGYLYQEAISEWSNTTEYSSTSVVKVKENNNLVFYQSLVDNNIGHSLTSTSYWKKVDFVMATGNQTISGTKTFSSTISGNISGSSTSCTGNSATATKATQDGSGNNIVSTYSTKAETRAIENSINTKILDMLETIYPIGSIYLTVTDTCPIASLFGSWELVSSGKALWTGNGSNANTTITAGLPNIAGYVQFSGIDPRTTDGAVSGAFTKTNYSGAGNSHDYPVDNARVRFTFNASNSNSIYGKSTTVQPPAYVVNVWRRIS